MSKKYKDYPTHINITEKEYQERIKKYWSKDDYLKQIERTNRKRKGGDGLLQCQYGSTVSIDELNERFNALDWMFADEVDVIGKVINKVVDDMQKEKEKEIRVAKAKHNLEMVGENIKTLKERRCNHTQRF